MDRVLKKNYIHPHLLLTVSIIFVYHDVNSILKLSFLFELLLHVPQITFTFFTMVTSIIIIFIMISFLERVALRIYQKRTGCNRLSL